MSRAAKLALLAALASAGCGLLQTPEAALAARIEELDRHPLVLPLDRAGVPPLHLAHLRLDPPRLQPMDGDTLRVTCVLWAEAELGGARLVFHGPDEISVVRPTPFNWRVDLDLPRLKRVALALLDRAPPAPVEVWQVGVEGSAEAEVREEYRKDASGRPLRAASRLTLSLK